MTFPSNGPVLRHLFSVIAAAVVYCNINIASAFLPHAPSKIIPRAVHSSSRTHPIITITTSSLRVRRPRCRHKIIRSASVIDNTDGGGNVSADLDVCTQVLGRALEKMKAISDPDSTLMSAVNKRRMSSIEVKPSSMAGAGLGVFSKKAIKKGAIVSFYPAHAIGVGFETEEERIIAIDAQGNIREREPSEDQDYIHYLLGKQRNADTLASLGGTSLYIDVDPSTELRASFVSHRINDGATVLSNSEEGVLTYYEETRAKKNCAHVPFGPLPLLATIATKKISKGEELFTSYGCQYWLGQLRETAGEGETDMTDAIIDAAKGVARDAYDSMMGVAVTNSEEARELEALFERP